MTQSVQDRDVILGELLALMPEEARRPSHHRRSRTVLAISAFVVAGAATGGAISAAAISSPPEEPPILPSAEQLPESVGDAQLDASIWVAVALANSLATQTGREFIGTSYTVVGDSESTLALTRPAGATDLAYSIVCAGPGTYSLAVDGAIVASLVCTDDPDDPNAVGNWLALAEGEHELTVTGTSGYAAWASWIG